MLDAFLTNCRLADGRVVDIGIADGKIAIVGEGAAPTSSNSAPALDIDGDLVLPGEKWLAKFDHYVGGEWQDSPRPARAVTLLNPSLLTKKEK